MPQHFELVPLREIEIHQSEILLIKRNVLTEILVDQSKLNHYADHVIQAQSQLLDGVNPQLTQKLSSIIAQLIEQLSHSKKILKQRKFNTLQKWLGSDLEFFSQQAHYYKNVDTLLDQAHQLSQKLQQEIQGAQLRFQQLNALRENMALHIIAAEEFLEEYPNFSKQNAFATHFAERLSKKIQSLYTLQASNDIAIAQMQLSYQLAFTLLDRFKEAQQVLIPAWQYHLKQSKHESNHPNLENLDKSRDKLIQQLKNSIAKSQQ